MSSHTGAYHGLRGNPVHHMLTILLLCLAYLEGRLNQALSGSVTQEHPLNSLPGLQSGPQALDETEPYMPHLHTSPSSQLHCSLEESSTHEMPQFASRSNLWIAVIYMDR